MNARLELWSRLLLALTGVLLVFTGLAFFVFSDYAAANFPWNVSVFVAMTIGGWSLGMGLMALETFRGWELPTFASTLVTVWAFCLLELVVVVAFRGVLRTDHLLTWPYLGALLAGSASAAFGLPWLWRNRARLSKGTPAPRLVLLIMVGFIVLTTALAAATAVLDGSTSAVFPESLSGFTMRAFSAFFASLAVGTVPILASRCLEPVVAFTRTGLYLLVTITAAAFLFLHVFDFAAHPGQLIYIGTYVLAIVVAVSLLVAYRARVGGAAARWRP
ncbi:MAG: hypothetical protein ABI797_02840 [Chloroflexota bacterium]